MKSQSLQAKKKKQKNKNRNFPLDVHQLVFLKPPPPVNPPSRVGKGVPAPGSNDPHEPAPTREAHRGKGPNDAQTSRSGCFLSDFNAGHPTRIHVPNTLLFKPHVPPPPPPQHTHTQPVHAPRDLAGDCPCRKRLPSLPAPGGRLFARGDPLSCPSQLLCSLQEGTAKGEDTAQELQGQLAAQGKKTNPTTKNTEGQKEAPPGLRAPALPCAPAVTASRGVRAASAPFPLGAPRLQGD